LIPRFNAEYPLHPTDVCDKPHNFDIALWKEADRRTGLRDHSNAVREIPEGRAASASDVHRRIPPTVRGGEQRLHGVSNPEEIENLITAVQGQMLAGACLCEPVRDHPVAITRSVEIDEPKDDAVNAGRLLPHAAVRLC